MRKALYSYALLLALVTKIAMAKDFAMVHYTVEDGLPGNTIYYIYKDSKGFLWFSSDKGIARYNGIRFERFTTSDGLPDNEIFFFKEDYESRLWLATFNGELCYYHNGTFYNATNDALLKLPFKKSFIQDITLASDSSLVIGFYDRAKWVVLKGHERTILSFNNVIKPLDNTFFRIDRKNSNRYELLFSNSILNIDSNSNVLSKTVFSKHNYRYSIAQNQEYLFTSDSLYSISGKGIAPMNKAAYAQDYIYHIYIHDGHIFYCTDKGLYINNDIHVFNDYKISGIERDIEGNYWISTLGNGVYKLSKDFLAISQYNNSYSGEVMYARTSGSFIFYATDKGNLYRFDPQNNISIAGFFKNKQGYQPNYQAFLMDNRNVFYSFNDTDIIVADALYTQTARQKLYRGKFTGGYKSLFSDGKYIYLKRFRGIDYIDFSKVASKGNGIPVVKLQSYCLMKERVFGMAQDTHHIFWVSTVDSMYKIVDGKPVAQPGFENLAFKWFDICGNYIVGCTHDNKLAICNRVGDKVFTDKATGHNCIWEKLYMLDSNHFLIGTNNLYRILTLYPSNGKPSYNISIIENPYIPHDAENICSNGNECFFFKQGNVTMVNKNILLAKPSPPVLLFNALKTARRTYNITNTTEIPYKEARNISISFSTLAFNSAGVAYQYSVSGDGTDNWTDLNGDINIAQPGFGYFTVKVRAKSLSGNYGNPIGFTLHVLRPYWATWWFITLAIFTGCIIVAYSVRRRISLALQKKQRLHESEIRYLKSEYKAMNALMNPHFIFNTLNNVQDLIHKNDKHAASEYLRFFADLIRQNMHNISKEMVSLQKEMDLIKNYLRLEKLRFEDHLNYSIEIEPAIDLSEIMIPPLLVQPLVENAVKHGIYPLQSPDGQIRITIHEVEEVLYICVMDNGVGLDSTTYTEATSHESFGLQNIKARIEQLNFIQGKTIALDIKTVNEQPGTQSWTVATITIQLH